MHKLTVNQTPKLERYKNGSLHFTASEEQSHVAEEINHSIENVRQLADQTSEGSQESVVAVNTLKTLSTELNTRSARFKTKS